MIAIANEVIMIASSIRWVILSATIGACAVFGTGCAAEVYDEGPESPGVVTEGYRPAYYDGYVVYYDGYGRPFYHGSGGGVYYVPATYVGYNGLVSHYHTYREPYHRWYGSRGYRYRTYRTPARVRYRR
jgi:hypothetical protein